MHLMNHVHVVITHAMEYDSVNNGSRNNNVHGNYYRFTCELKFPFKSMFVDIRHKKKRSKKHKNFK